MSRSKVLIPCAILQAIGFSVKYRTRNSLINYVISTKNRGAGKTHYFNSGKKFIVWHLEINNQENQYVVCRQLL